MNRLLWWVTTPFRKIDNAILGDPMKPSVPPRDDYFYHDLLRSIERMVLNSGKPEARKIGAWMRDVRIAHESGLADDRVSLFEEMQAVLLEIHKRHHVSSDDPLWGRIDALAHRLRA